MTFESSFPKTSAGARRFRANLKALWDIADAGLKDFVATAAILVLVLFSSASFVQAGADWKVSQAKFAVLRDVLRLSASYAKNEECERG